MRCWGESLWVMLGKHAYGVVERRDMTLGLSRNLLKRRQWVKMYFKSLLKMRMSNEWYGLIQKEKFEQREAQRGRDLQLFIYLTLFICDLTRDLLHLLFLPPGQQLKCSVRFDVCVWINTLWHIVIHHWRVNLWLDLPLWSVDSICGIQSKIVILFLLFQGIINVWYALNFSDALHYTLAVEGIDQNGKWGKK